MAVFDYKTGDFFAENLIISPEKARFPRKDFPPIFSENLGLKPPFASPGPVWISLTLGSLMHNWRAAADWADVADNPPDAREGTSVPQLLGVRERSGRGCSPRGDTILVGHRRESLKVTIHPDFFYKFIPLPVFFLLNFFLEFLRESLAAPIFFVTRMRSSGSRVDIAQKNSNKSGQILDQRWKYFL